MFRYEFYYYGELIEKFNSYIKLTRTDIKKRKTWLSGSIIDGALIVRDINKIKCKMREVSTPIRD